MEPDATVESILHFCYVAIMTFSLPPKQKYLQYFPIGDTRFNK